MIAWYIFTLSSQLHGRNILPCTTGIEPGCVTGFGQWEVSKRFEMCLHSWVCTLRFLKMDMTWVAHVSKQDEETHGTDLDPTCSLKQGPVEISFDQLTQRYECQWTVVNDCWLKLLSFGVFIMQHYYSNSWLIKLLCILFFKMDLGLGWCSNKV